jgi:gliding motility-associated-like protein
MMVQLDFTGSGADSLFWDMGDGTTFEGDTSITYYYTTPGTYYLVFEAYDTLCNNSFIKTDTIDFNPSYTAVNAVVPPNIFLCQAPYNVTFNGNSPAPPNTYWDFGDGIGTAINNNNPAYTYADTGSYTVMYVTIDSSTCNIADTAYFNVLLVQTEAFSATLDFNPPPPCGTSSFDVVLNFTGAGADSLIWDRGDGTQIINVDSTVYTYSSTGTYLISMTAFNFKCNLSEIISNTVTFTDVVSTDGLIPNVFTPNGDGMNDKLIFVGVDGTKEFELKIYNRWGKLAFKTTTATDYWDGKIGGTIASAGTYYYHLTYTDVCDSEEKIVNGFVTLLK